MRDNSDELISRFFSRRLMNLRNFINSARLSINWILRVIEFKQISVHESSEKRIIRRSVQLSTVLVMLLYDVTQMMKRVSYA